MHRSVMTFVEAAAARYGLNHPGLHVLEVGALDVNGSVRSLFGKVERYVGIDQLAGKGVDHVANAHAIPFEHDVFDVVVSTEMLEHDPEPWLSVSEMGRVLKIDGILVVTARGIGFPHHSYPDDFYRYTPEAIRHLVEEYAGLSVLEIRDDPEASGVFAVAQKLPL